MIKYGATCLIKDTIKDLEEQFETAKADKKAAEKELDNAKVAYLQKQCQENIKKYRKSQK
jgi:hypothetical protein